jgi:hypothetical protein
LARVRWRWMMAAALAMLAVAPVARAERRPSERTTQLRVIELGEPDGQILSYRHLAGSTEVHMRGTALAPDAHVKLKIGSRPGFVELDINRGEVIGLKPAHRLGKDFLTYVLWAVSVDGKASNLGEITFEGENPISVNVTTPYQTFWLMVTAEPNYAVVDPSQQIILYSVKQTNVTDNRALPIAGDLFFFTHYSPYESTPGELSNVPNQLLQARKAVELASKSGRDRGGSLWHRRAQGRRVHARGAHAGDSVPRSRRDRVQERSERPRGRAVRAHGRAERRELARACDGRRRRPARPPARE